VRPFLALPCPFLDLVDKSDQLPVVFGDPDVQALVRVDALDDLRDREREAGYESVERARERVDEESNTSETKTGNQPSVTSKQVINQALPRNQPSITSTKRHLKTGNQPSVTS
jgi:hypothetical protein